MPPARETASRATVRRAADGPGHVANVHRLDGLGADLPERSACMCELIRLLLRTLAAMRAAPS